MVATVVVAVFPDGRGNVAHDSLGSKGKVGFMILTSIRYFPRILMFALMLGLAACARGNVDNTAAANATGIAADPSSPAYFNQTIGDRVFFVVDQSTLTAAAQQTLIQQAEWFRTNPQYTALIEGHADEQGTREYNLALGARRAAAVRDFLVAQGVADGRLRTISYGKERPVEICSNESCYAQNRRSVTVVSAGSGV